MNAFFRKLRWLTRRSDKEAELQEELRFHLEEEAEHAEARDRRGRGALGGTPRAGQPGAGAGEHPRRLGVGVPGASGPRRQPRAAPVRRNPTFSAIAIATLALGIGGMTAMFSAFDSVLIRPLPYADADRLVMIWNESGKTDVTTSTWPRRPNGSNGAGSTQCSPISPQPAR